MPRSFLSSWFSWIVTWESEGSHIPLKQPWWALLETFSSEAGLWFQPLVVIQRHLLEQFEGFIQVLQEPFNNPGNMEDANHCILQLCQSDDPGHQYETHFILITPKLNCIQFQEGLASSIWDELSHTRPATNLSDLITQCISREEKLSGKPDTNSQGVSPSEERTVPGSPPGENQLMQAASNYLHLTEAEWAHHREGHCASTVVILDILPEIALSSLIESSKQET